MRILQIEFIKLGRLANYILVGIFSFFIIALTGALYYAISKGKVTDLNEGNVAQAITGLEGMLTLLLSIFLIINIGKEFSENTLKRSIIDGYTRDEFFNGKFFLMLVTVVFIYAIYNISILTAALSDGKMDIVKSYYTAPNLINPLIKFLAAGIFAFFLAFITRSIAIGLVLYFVWGIAEAIIAGIQNVLNQWKDWHLKLDIYLPLTSMNKVLMSPDVVEKPVLFVSVAYLLIMLLASYWLFVKRDIK